ncbi:MAG: N-6 DNA methylase [Aggregatilineales bacterium]
MQYRYVTEKENYEDFAAGRVLLSQRGMTSFPVRLASEIFQRCADYFPIEQRLSIYDPCCGGGYLLTVIGFLHSACIQSLHGSDINSDTVRLASDNLRLLTAEGLDARRNTLCDLAKTYNKASHHDALESVERLRQYLPASPIPTQTWAADALQPTADTVSVDLIICDVPYGNVTDWQADADDNLITSLLQAQYDVLVAGGIIAVVSDKSQKATYPRYKRLQQDTIGKRRFLILQKV